MESLIGIISIWLKNRCLCTVNIATDNTFITKRSTGPELPVSSSNAFPQDKAKGDCSMTVDDDVFSGRELTITIISMGN